MNDSLEPGRENLRRALVQLPAHEPDDAVWLGIVTQVAIAQATPTLPQHEPDEELWAAIASRLDAVQPVVPSVVGTDPVVRPLWPRVSWWAAGLAATILLVLGVWMLQPRPADSPPTAAVSAPRETITFSEEAAAPAAPVRLVSTVDPLGQEGEAFIDAHCASLPDVCQSREFRALRRQLTEVEGQERRLRQDAQRFGASPELVRQQVQLTSLRATITRELVQLIIS